MSYIHLTIGSHRIALLARCAFAASALALSAAPAVAGCNSGNVANTVLLSSSECQANATGGSAVAVGPHANASGTGSTAFGFLATAKGAKATAVGYSAGPPNTVAGATSVGAFSGVIGAGVYSTAIGSGDDSASGSYAQGSYSIAIGGGDGAVFTPTIGPAINLNGARATGFISMAFGPASQATGGGSSAFGLGSRAIGNDSAAYGEFSTASGAKSVAMGLFSNASGTSSIALGGNAKATMARSVAIGDGSLANVANTVSVGTNAARRRIVNVASAVANSDAATLGQVKALATAAAIEAIAATSKSPASDDVRREMGELRAMVRTLQQEVSELQRRDTVAQSEFPRP